MAQILHAAFNQHCPDSGIPFESASRAFGITHRERQLTQLTDLGKIVLPMLERTLAAADAVRINAREFQRKTIAPLRVALTPSISAAIVMKPLQAIALYVPGLQIELVEARRDQVLDHFAQR